MICRPLPQQLSNWTGICNLIGGRTGEMIDGDIANGVAAGLNGMHLNLGQSLQNIWHIFELRPVELNVLAGGEMTVALVPTLGNHCQLCHLKAVERTIRDSHAQHISMQLQI